MSWRWAIVVAALVALCSARADAAELSKKHSRPMSVIPPLPAFFAPFAQGMAGLPTLGKMPYMAGMSPMPGMPGMPRFADARAGAGARDAAHEPLGESTSQADDTDRDFVRSIYNLLSRSRDANVADNSVLEKQKLETEKKQQELNRKAEILKSRAAMLTRLQYCLEKDASTEGKVLPRPPTPPQGSSGPTAAQRDLAKKLADLESQLALRKKELDDMAKDLANRENNLNQRINDIHDQEKRIIQLKNDANVCNCPPPIAAPNATVPLPEPEKCPPPVQCSHRDDDFPKIEKCVGPVVGHSRPQHVRCWKSCNRNPTCFRQCLLTASKTVGNLDRFRSRRSDSASGAVSGEEAEEEAPVLADSGRRVVLEPAAATIPVSPVPANTPAAALAPAAEVVSNKMRFASQQKSSAPAAPQNPWMAADSKLGTCPGRCDLYQRCDLCAADPNCGWCSSTQRCHDVNEGKSKCAEADYSIMYCREQTCSQHRFCSSCMSDPKCGMCHSTGRCMKGGITGPADGSCNNWSYASGLRFLSLNIYGRDMTNCTARGNVIFQMLEHANADFVALQEVEDWFLELLSRQKWAANYHMSDFGSGHAPGGLLILSKVPLASVAYYERTMPGQVEVDQRGRMLVVHPKMGNNKFAFATTTLDWRSTDSRSDSMEFLFSVLNTTKDVVLTGDFNFDQNAQPETAQIPFNFEDVWQSLRPQHVGFTWDPSTNSYAHNSDPNSRPSRIDRMLVKAGFWEARKIQKIGSPLASPHYGLLAQLELFGAYC